MSHTECSYAWYEGAYSSASNETITNLREAYRLLYSKGLMKEGIEEIKANLEVTPEIQYIIDFVESSERGIIR